MINIEILNETAQNLPPALISEPVKRVVDELQLGHDLTLTVRLTDDKRMQELNRRHLHHDYPTDVLSFPLFEFREGQAPQGLPAGPLLLGEIVVNLDAAQRQAQTAGHSLNQELQYLLEHGARHLGGWHHD